MIDATSDQIIANIKTQLCVLNADPRSAWRIALIIGMLETLASLEGVLTEVRSIVKCNHNAVELEVRGISCEQ